MTAMWSKDHKSWGSRKRKQRNAYAWRVTLRMTGGGAHCPACLGPLDIDTAEVDRAVPAVDYCPGNIVYLCRGCNQGRSILQSHGRDWARIADYVNDVIAASQGVPIPTESESDAWWNTRPVIVTHPRYA